jgi:hypothetical protein
MGKYRKKPVVIEAFMYAGGMVEPGWPDGWLSCPHNFDATGEAIYIPTLEGVMKAEKGDFIVKGVNGEFYPCKPDIFAKTYEEVSGA